MSLLQYTSWLNAPYPHFSDHKLRWATALAVGLIVFIFLVVYKPFGVAEIQSGSAFILGFGICVATSLLISYYSLPRLSSFFNPESWSVKTEIVFHVINFSITATLNYIYNSTIGAHISPQHSWLAFVYITVATGVFPLLLMIYSSERYLSKSNSQHANDLQKDINRSVAISAKSITIRSTVETEQSLTISSDNFICAQSANNYCTVSYINHGQVKNTLIRISLKSLMEQVVSAPVILRCHKSYAINKNKIRDIKGNARSLHVSLEGIEKAIPVSRSFDRTLLVG